MNLIEVQRLKGWCKKKWMQQPLEIDMTPRGDNFIPPFKIELTPKPKEIPFEATFEESLDKSKIIGKTGRSWW